MLRLRAVLVLSAAVASSAALADQQQAVPVKAPETGPLKLLIGAPLGADRAKADADRLAALLTKLLGRPVAGVVVPDSEISDALSAGKGDLAWLSAMEYVHCASHTQGLKAQAGPLPGVAPVAQLLRGGLPFYRSVLFTRKGTKIVTPADLKSKLLAFVREDSAAGYLLPRQTLLASGLTDAELKKFGSFLGDHAAVCAAVADGKVAAGATVSNDRAGQSIAGCKETLGERANELKVISTSDPIPNDVIAVRPGYPAEGYAALRAALLGLGSTEQGKAVLAEVFHGDGFSPADDADFALLRETLKPAAR
jgi:phosphonate transport system substrate-binding protein